MAYNLKEVAKKPERLTGGHRMCAGCGAPIVVRQVLKALNRKIMRLSQLQQVVWKFQLSFTLIQHGRILSFTVRLKIPVLQFPVRKRLIKY